MTGIRYWEVKKKKYKLDGTSARRSWSNGANGSLRSECKMFVLDELNLSLVCPPHFSCGTGNIECRRHPLVWPKYSGIYLGFGMRCFGGRGQKVFPRKI
jgi:hypothetical protein